MTTGLVRRNFCIVSSMLDKLGGLNGSTQHQLEVYLHEFLECRGILIFQILKRCIDCVLLIASFQKEGMHIAAGSIFTSCAKVPGMPGCPHLPDLKTVRPSHALIREEKLK